MKILSSYQVCIIIIDYTNRVIIVPSEGKSAKILHYIRLSYGMQHNMYKKYANVTFESSCLKSFPQAVLIQ